MKKIYLVILALIAFALTMVLFKTTATGSYIPFIPWGGFVVILFVWQYFERKNKIINKK